MAVCLCRRTSSVSARRSTPRICRALAAAASCGGWVKRSSEELGRRPARFYVRQYVQVKYACPRCQDQIVRPPLPDKVFERGLAGADVVAHVLVGKYADHLPLHRQETIYRREGVHLDKSTTCDWVDRSADLLRPVVGRSGGRCWPAQSLTRTRRRCST